ncbi:UNVERIFIED_CONTAM: hypothetical protein GTU68_035413 [Idotea baltica]|nr:hypothetical protein [Idotea baltica]
MPITSLDINAILLTLKLAATSTFFLLIIGTPLALWLSKDNSNIKKIISAIIALPLVLPPTVIGFYLLIAMAPSGLIGKLSQALGLGLLSFTFTGLVIGSIIYSLPFVVQPLQSTFESIDTKPIEVAATLGASPLDRFFSIILPLSRSGFITAAVLGFSHTLGEFGVVLMIGGNIPGETQVASLQIYNHVEALQYTQAHWLSAGVLLFSFVMLLILYAVKPAKLR